MLRGRLSLPIPEIVAEGERDGWPYLVITRLEGVLGSDAWPSLPEEQKERVLAQIGETIAEVQRVPPGALLDIEPRWDAFMRRQIAGCRARHERLGLASKFLDGLDDLLRDAAELIPINGPPVILTGEYIPENFLLANDGGAWRLAGLIDFGDVQTGFGEYDLLGPSAFMAAGRPRRVQSLFEGFGYSRADVNFCPEAPADGVDAAASGQRSGPAHLHRRLAGAGQRPRAASGADLAGLNGTVTALIMSKAAALYASCRSPAALRRLVLSGSRSWA